ncbi:MAG: hypothetical protein H7Z40_12705 [Phycisphaerae bacterium]|nr:hypothetical protein [Gemmatimonadaceae bacterium]
MKFARFNLRQCLAAAALVFTLASCETPSGIPAGRHPPYLAVLVSVDAPTEVTSRGPYRFRVREMSGTLNIDTTFSASPKDTTILSVPAASYRVDISDVPPTCGVRDGTAQAIVVPPNTNTSLVRFAISCAPALVVAAYTDGVKPDSDFVLTVQGATGNQYATVLAANDTVRVDGLPAGNYEVSLRHVATNCVITSDGGEQVSVKITPAGGAFVPFRIVCADVARRPRIVQLSGSYSGGSIGYLIRATDPDKDIERTFVDVTDCNRRSVIPSGGRRRGGFSGAANVSYVDTAVVVGGYDLEVAESVLANRCLAAWVADERGNTSEFIEVPLTRRDAARGPVASAFNARLNGTVSLSIGGTFTDPNNDYVGVFAVYVLRDGAISLPDGQPDKLVAQSAGIIGRTVPDLPLGIGFGAWNDYLGVVIYLIDRAGNFTRLQDLDLFQ